MFVERLLHEEEENEHEHFRDSIYNFNRIGKSKAIARSKFFDIAQPAAPETTAFSQSLMGKGNKLRIKNM